MVDVVLCRPMRREKQWNWAPKKKITSEVLIARVITCQFKPFISIAAASRFKTKSQPILSQSDDNVLHARVARGPQRTQYPTVRWVGVFFFRSITVYTKLQCNSTLKIKMLFLYLEPQVSLIDKFHTHWPYDVKSQQIVCFREPIGSLVVLECA